MKHFASLLLVSILFCLVNACQTTKYTGYLGNSATTQIELSEDNFNVLGSFTGIATTRKVVWGIKDRAGLISEAKRDLLENAKKAGAELKGPRALINFTVDLIENNNRITCTVSAEVIEFTN